MPRKRDLRDEQKLAGFWIPYYEARGDLRSAQIMRSHQAQIANVMLHQNLVKVGGRNLTQDEILMHYQSIAPDVAKDEKLQAQIQSITHTRSKAVFYASKVTGKAAAAGLFWARQGRIEAYTTTKADGRSGVALLAGGVMLRKRLSRNIDAALLGEHKSVALHSGSVVAAAPTNFAFVRPDARQTELIVGADEIEYWAVEAQEDPVFGAVAVRLAAHIARTGISNKDPFPPFKRR